MQRIQPFIRTSPQWRTADSTNTEGQHKVPPSPNKNNPIQVAQDSYSAGKFSENEWGGPVEIYSDSL